MNDVIFDLIDYRDYAHGRDFLYIFMYEGGLYMAHIADVRTWAIMANGTLHLQCVDTANTWRALLYTVMER